jgi:hypothetical protein
MAQVTRGPIKDVYFGFNARALFVRVDLDGKAGTVLADFDRLRIGFVEPAGHDVLVTPSSLNVRLQSRGKTADATGIEVAIDHIVEAAIPFERLGVAVDQPIQFFVELYEGQQSRDRAPREGTISLLCPSPDFEQIMWDV